MSEQLAIRFIGSSVDALSPVDWSLYSGDGEYIDSGRMQLNAISGHLEQYEELNISVIVPAEAVFLTTANVPSTQIKQVQRALPFVVEELVSVDIESVHLATLKPLKIKDGSVDVAVVAHEVLIGWLDNLHSNSLSPSRIIVDVLCVPHDANEVSILVDQQRILVRTGKCSGLVVDASSFDVLFSILLKEQFGAAEGAVLPVIKLLSANDSDDDQLSAKIGDTVRRDHPEIELIETQYKESVNDLLAASSFIDPVHELNLLQGGYAVDMDDSGGWQQWRMVASVAAVSLAAYLLLMLGNGLYFDYKADQLEAQSFSLYRQFFPNERRVVSPRKQMQNHLRSGNVTSNANFLQLLADTSGHLSDGDSPLKLEQMRFDSENGNLQLEVKGGSIEQFDQLKKKLTQAGLQLDITSAVEQDDFVMGRLVVRAL